MNPVIVSDVAATLQDHYPKVTYIITQGVANEASNTGYSVSASIRCPAPQLAQGILNAAHDIELELPQEVMLTLSLLTMIEEQAVFVLEDSEAKEMLDAAHKLVIGKITEPINKGDVFVICLMVDTPAGLVGCNIIHGPTDKIVRSLQSLYRYSVIPLGLEALGLEEPEKNMDDDGVYAEAYQRLIDRILSVSTEAPGDDVKSPDSPPSEPSKDPT